MWEKIQIVIVKIKSFLHSLANAECSLFMCLPSTRLWMSDWFKCVEVGEVIHQESFPLCLGAETH